MSIKILSPTSLTKYFLFYGAKIRAKPLSVKYSKTKQKLFSTLISSKSLKDSAKDTSTKNIYRIYATTSLTTSLTASLQRILINCNISPWLNWAELSEYSSTCTLKMYVLFQFWQARRWVWTSGETTSKNQEIFMSFCSKDWATISMNREWQKIKSRFISKISEGWYVTLFFI